MPKVYNKRNHNTPIGAIYVGRPTKWGNRHPIGYCRYCRISHDRKGAIAHFRNDLEDNPVLVAESKVELRGHDLECWCPPEDCHAYVWIEVANSGEVQHG